MGFENECPEGRISYTAIGCVATFKNQQESDGSGRPGSVSCSHREQLVDELNLLPNIRTAHPPRLTDVLQLLQSGKRGKVRVRPPEGEPVRSILCGPTRVT